MGAFGPLTGVWEQWQDGLQQNSLPFELLLVGHCLFIALLCRGPYREFWLVNYFVTFMAAFGGGTIASLLAFEVPVWFHNNLFPVVFTVCWYLIHYSPQDIMYKICSFLPIKAVCQACMNILRGGLIVALVHSKSKEFPGAIVAPLLLGTIGGCAGKFFGDAAAFAMGIKQAEPAEFAKPSWILRSGFASALFCWVTSEYLKFLPGDVADVSHGLLCTAMGRFWDPTAPFAKLFHQLTGIPEPFGQPSKAASTSASSVSRRKKKQ
eukprot:jgi/Chlat1/7120/Chrsp57S06736